MMNRSMAARRANRLFWSVLGGSLLILCGGILMARSSEHTDAPATVLETCLAMMQQVWGIMPQHDLPSPFALMMILLILASGVWAGMRWLATWNRTRRVLAHAQPYRCGRWPSLDTALATLPQGRQRLRVFEAPYPVACTIGLWRPRILLSTGMIATLSATEMGAVLGHEWGHVIRRDPLRVALLRGCRDMLWFLPILGALAHDSTRVMEDAADDMAVAMTHQPLELAAALVKTAKARVPTPWPPTPALGGEHNMVAERVERLLQVAPGRPPQWHARAWAVSFAAAMCLLGLFMLSRHPAATATSMPLFAPERGVTMCPTPTLQG
jgi:Zn-dependent protease with chaperone function